MRALSTHLAHETSGAARIRHSLRPLDLEGVSYLQTSGAMRRENEKPSSCRRPPGAIAHGRSINIPETAMTEREAAAYWILRLRGDDRGYGDSASPGIARSTRLSNPFFRHLLHGILRVAPLTHNPPLTRLDARATSAANAAVMNAPELQKLTDWLIDGAWSAANPAGMMAETCERLVPAGLPLWRVGVFVRTLHPDIFGRNFIWRPGAEVEVGTVDFNIVDSPEFRASPLTIVFSRERRSGPARRSADPRASRSSTTCAPKASPIISRCRCCSPTARSTPRAGPRNSRAASPTSIWRRCAHWCRPLARVIEIIQWRRTSSILLDTYVGNRAGERILGGQIRRGHTETMHAAIWLSDLRGFTALSDRLPAETVVDILNQLFRLPGGRDQGPWRRGPEVHGRRAARGVSDRRICRRCPAGLRACAGSRATNPAPASRRCSIPVGDTVERFRFGVALHVGRILYGNIGGGNRLDFTCIGPAVNLAARLEKIASKLAAPWWHRKDLPASAAAAGAISANFRSRAFRRPSAFMA